MEILDKINHTEELRKLTIQEKENLAEELREITLNTVSKTGGHLASNLGVVELTIALHSTFETPIDKIIWDVGHQTYIHKILTGRKDRINTLRQLDGLSGFPKVAESEYDCFETGHSSTSISAGLGMARARDIQKQNYHVVAVIGDGALTGGMALEALNDAGCSKTNLIVILNDNTMSISKNVGGISMFLTKLRTRKGYEKSNKYIKQLVKKLPENMSEAIIHFVRRMKDGIKQLVIPNMLFEDLGFKYLGPVDGHNIEKLEDIFRKAKEQEGPVLVHVLTKKGKGYIPAETNPDRFHATSSFNLVTGESEKKKSKDYSAVFGETIVELAKQDDKIVGITAAMKDGTGFTEFAKQFPDRFFDAGIAEQHSLTMAAGMAKMGIKPVVSIYSSFYQRGYDQVIHDIAMQNLPVVMCVDRAGIVGNDGETHQGIFDLAFFNLVPNLTIMAPKDFTELKQMLTLAVNLNSPVVIRYPRGGEEKDIHFETKELLLGKAEMIESISEKIEKQEENIEIKKKEIESETENLQLNETLDFQKNNSITIIGIGKMVVTAQKVANLLKEQKVQVELINARFLKPFDEQTILQSIQKTKRVVTIEDGILEGGLASKVVELLQKNNLSDIKIQSYGYPDEFIRHGKVEEIEEIYGLTPENIAKNITEKMLEEAKIQKIRRRFIRNNPKIFCKMLEEEDKKLENE